MSLRTRLRDWLLKDMPAHELLKATKPAIHDPGTVVEATEVPRWQEKQSGNVIIVEPDIMKEFRRNNGNV